jgi:hypothetical protein
MVRLTRSAVVLAVLGFGLAGCDSGSPIPEGMPKNPEYKTIKVQDYINPNTKETYKASKAASKAAAAPAPTPAPDAK